MCHILMTFERYWGHSIKIKWQAEMSAILLLDLRLSVTNSDNHIDYPENINKTFAKVHFVKLLSDRSLSLSK